MQNKPMQTYLESFFQLSKDHMPTLTTGTTAQHPYNNFGGISNGPKPPQNTHNAFSTNQSMPPKLDGYGYRGNPNSLLEKKNSGGFPDARDLDANPEMIFKMRKRNEGDEEENHLLQQIHKRIDAQNIDRSVFDAELKRAMRGLYGRHPKSFRDILLEAYNETCATHEIKRLVEQKRAEAGIPKEKPTANEKRPPRSKEEFMEIFKRKQREKEEDNERQAKRKAAIMNVSAEDISATIDEQNRQLEQYRQKMKVESENKFNMNFVISDEVADAQYRLMMQKSNDPNILIYEICRHDFNQPPASGNCEPLPLKFSNDEEYITAFEPLFLNECFIQIQADIKTIKKKAADTRKAIEMKFLGMEGSMLQKFSMREPSTKAIPSAVPQNKTNSHPGKDKKGSMVPEVNDEDGKDGLFLGAMKNYLIFVSSQPTLDLSMLNQSKYFGRHQFLFLGVVCQEDHTDFPKFKCSIDYTFFSRCIPQDNIRAYIFPIQKITTLIREFVAIHSLRFNDSYQLLCNPQNISQNISLHPNSAIYDPIYKKLQPFYNPSQMEAIKRVSSLRKGIYLIQGPPGTGKTHTLVGMLSAIFHDMKNDKVKRYVMVCAPSNAAIDEIITRLVKVGLYDADKEKFNPNVVRVGVLDKNPIEHVKQTSLEYRAQREMNKQVGKDKQTIVELKIELDKLDGKIEKLKKDPKSDKKIIEGLYDKRRNIYSMLSDLRNEKKIEKEKYSEIIERILVEADIICCTLGSAGSEKLNNIRNSFDTVIIDEAAQAVEPTTLIPLQYAPKRIILIGDPKQLPATTFDPNSNKTLYNRSLFERILENNNQPGFLDEQYRMHSNIRKFASRQFYDDRLKDAPVILERPFPEYIKRLQNKNMFFFDIPYSTEKSVDASYENRAEAEFAMAFIEKLIRKLDRSQTNEAAIGLITPYRQQLRLFQQLIPQYHYVAEKKYSLEINTIDSFQGQEKDIIILNTVRASDRAGDNLIGFLSDARRMNVAITRARYCLYVIGNSRTLVSNPLWKSFLKHLTENKAYINVKNESGVEDVLKFIEKDYDLPEDFLVYVPPKPSFKRPSRPRSRSPDNFKHTNGDRDHVSRSRSRFDEKDMSRGERRQENSVNRRGENKNGGEIDRQNHRGMRNDSSHKSPDPKQRSSAPKTPLTAEIEAIEEEGQVSFIPDWRKKQLSEKRDSEKKSELSKMIPEQSSREKKDRNVNSNTKGMDFQDNARRTSLPFNMEPENEVVKNKAPTPIETESSKISRQNDVDGTKLKTVKNTAPPPDDRKRSLRGIITSTTPKGAASNNSLGRTAKQPNAAGSKNTDEENSNSAARGKSRTHSRMEPEEVAKLPELYIQGGGLDSLVKDYKPEGKHKESKFVPYNSDAHKNNQSDSKASTRPYIFDIEIPDF